jgi:hypothetical protein
MEEINKLYMQTIPDVDLIIVLMNFVFCIAMSLLVKKVYIKYSVSLTGKHHIGVILPLLAAIVFLVIMIVKSSLALSLGLVGALSIVRFRTPIKEPEELVYLFLAISIGLGYAAGHTLLTTILVLSILAMIYFWSSNEKNQKTNEYNLIVSWKDRTVSINDIFLKVSQFTHSSKWIRSDSNNNELSVAMLIIPRTVDDIQKITNVISDLDSNAEVSFYEAKTNW